MLGLILKIRYGKNAKAIERFIEFIAAVYFLIFVAIASLPATVITSALVMLVFCYAIAKPAWQVFTHPPLSIPPTTLATSLFLSSLLSAPMIVGVVASMIQFNIVIAVVMVTVSAAFFFVFARLNHVNNKPARLIHRPLLSVKSRLAQYLLLDWRRRHAKWLQRIAMPFVCYPLMGVVIVQLLVFYSGAQLSLAALPVGVSLGLICRLVYLRTDDEPGNFVREIAGLAGYWSLLPLGIVVIAATIIGQLLEPNLPAAMALIAATACALGIGQTKSIISDHRAPVHETVRVAQPTIVQDVMGILLIVAVYIGSYVFATLW